MHAAQPPVVLVVARTLQDAREAATNLGLREWATPGQATVHGRIWSGIVYVDGWERCALPVSAIQGAVAVARAGAAMNGGLLELDQHDSAWYFRGEILAHQAQVVLDRERALRRPAAALSVAPEQIDQAAAPVARLPWWRRLTRRR
jgi:hypothetical protein